MIFEVKDLFEDIKVQTGKVVYLKKKNHHLAESYNDMYLTFTAYIPYQKLSSCRTNV